MNKTEKATIALIRSEMRSLDAQIRSLRKVAKLTAEANNVAFAQLWNAESQKKDLLERAQKIQS
jgi:2,4-dienoyl-CoA reductase-like NADH-dependent reductase (Old Yellow Enzyme family)